MRAPVIFVSSRSYAEYERMFDLDLRGRAGLQVLDCAGGAASFTAGANAIEGVKAIAVDPLYGESRDAIAEATWAGVSTAHRNVIDRPEEYRWGHFYGSPRQHAEERESSARVFLKDFDSCGQNYVPGSVTALPFAGESFDIVLCSYLLFTYADSLSIVDHLRSITEMIRVSRSEVLVYPLCGFRCDASAHLDKTLQHLSRLDIHFELLASRCEFQTGAKAYLRVVKR